MEYSVYPSSFVAGEELGKLHFDADRHSEQEVSKLQHPFFKTWRLPAIDLSI